MLSAEKEFGSSVPPCRHVFSEDIGFDVVEKRSGQTEVADLEIAVGIHKQVPGFQISMDNLCGVDVLESSQQLVEEKLVVFLSEGLLALDDLCKVSIHHFGNDVNVLELFSGLGQNDSLDVDDILVFEKLEKPQFSESPFGENFVFEGFVDLFDGD